MSRFCKTSSHCASFDYKRTKWLFFRTVGGQFQRFLGPVGSIAQRDRITVLLLVRWYMSSLYPPYCDNRVLWFIPGDLLHFRSFSTFYERAPFCQRSLRYNTPPTMFMGSLLYISFICTLWYMLDLLYRFCEVGSGRVACTPTRRGQWVANYESGKVTVQRDLILFGRGSHFI